MPIQIISIKFDNARKSVSNACAVKVIVNGKMPNTLVNRLLKSVNKNEYKKSGCADALICEVIPLNTKASLLIINKSLVRKVLLRDNHFIKTVSSPVVEQKAIRVKRKKETLTYKGR